MRRCWAGEQAHRGQARRGIDQTSDCRPTSYLSCDDDWGGVNVCHQEASNPDARRNRIEPTADQDTHCMTFSPSELRIELAVITSRPRIKLNLGRPKRGHCQPQDRAGGILTKARDRGGEGSGFEARTNDRVSWQELELTLAAAGGWCDARTGARNKRTDSCRRRGRQEVRERTPPAVARDG